MEDTVFKGEIVKKPVTETPVAYADKLFKQGYAEYQRGNLSESLRLLNQALDQDPAHANARSKLAIILSQQGNVDLALTILNEGLAEHPEQVDWLKLKAKLLLQTGNVVQSASLLSKHNPPIANNTDYYAMKAAVMQKLNNHAQAARIYRDLLKVNPLKGIWWMGLGISLEALKRYSDAMFAYQKAMAYPTLAGASRKYVTERINTLTNLINDESS